MSIKVLWNNVLVKEKKEENSALIILESKDNTQIIEAEIVGYGDKIENDEIKTGKKVLFKKFNSIEIEIETEKFLMIKAEDILLLKD